MKKKIVLLLISLFILSSCTKPKDPSMDPEDPGINEPENPDDHDKPDNPGRPGDGDDPVTPDEPDEPNTPETPNDPEEPDTPTEDDDPETPANDEIPASGQSLPIGNKTVTGPKNSKNPVDISNYTTFDLFDSLPDNWSYIQGNNKIKNCNDFYAPSAGGGFKFSQLYYGLQTPVINSWVKIEIRFHISVVKSKSGQFDKEDPIFHIYGYDKNGQYISLDYLEQGKITVQQENNEVKLYVKNPNITYLEFRLNMYPCKGSTWYNFGVDEITLKGWQYE